MLDRTRLCEGRRPGSIPGEDMLDGYVNNRVPKFAPDGDALGYAPHGIRLDSRGDISVGEVS